MSLMVACAGRQLEPPRRAEIRALPRAGEYITRMAGDFRWSIGPEGINVTSPGVQRGANSRREPPWWEKAWGPVPLQVFETGPLWVLAGKAPTGDAIQTEMLTAQDGAMWVERGAGPTRLWRTRDVPKEFLGEWSVIEPCGVAGQPTLARVHGNGLELGAPDSMDRFDSTFVDGPGGSVIALGADGVGLQLSPDRDLLRISNLPWSVASLPWSIGARPPYAVARGRFRPSSPRLDNPLPLGPLGEGNGLRRTCYAVPQALRRSNARFGTETPSPHPLSPRERGKREQVERPLNPPN
jgi:hypothetical protein